MKLLHVSLNSIEKVKKFVNDMGKIEGDAFLLAGRYVIDAKSIMGIFSLDLSKPLNLKIEKWREEYAVLLHRYLIEEH